MKDKLVAVIVENGKCQLLCDVKAIEKQEYNKLLNESESHKAKLEYDKENDKAKVDLLMKRVATHELFLAKAIYDNFVDKGLLERNEQFDKDFYDFIFENKEFSFKNSPKEYGDILGKLEQDYEK